MKETEAVRLSRLLWDAREGLAVLADLVEAQTQKRDAFTRRVIEEIDIYRDERGWSSHGFGGES